MIICALTLNFFEALQEKKHLKQGTLTE